MSLKRAMSRSLHYLRASFVALMIFQFGVGGFLAAPAYANGQNGNDRGNGNGNGETASPIKHVIVLIGENRTFDHLFATYKSPSGEPVKNLLSEGIINADGTPGKHFGRAAQFQAIAPFKTQYYIHLNNNEKAPYTTLPEPSLNFSPSPVTGEPPPFPVADLPFLGAIEPSLETADLVLLTTGASGAEQTAEFFNPVTDQILDADTRVANFNALPNWQSDSHWKHAALRLLHRRHHAPALRDVATVRLRHTQRDLRQSVGLLERPLSFCHLQLYE